MFTEHRRRWLGSGLSACCLLLVSSAARADFASECARLRHQISVLEAPLQYQISQPYDIATLDSMAPPPVSEHARQRNHVMGITRLESNSLFQLFLRSLEQGGNSCVEVQVTLNLRIPPAQVYLARELQPGTCPYQAVLAHELQHVDIYRQQLPRVAQRMREALQTRFGSKPLYYPSGSAQAALQQELQQVWNPLLQAEMNKVEAAQSRLDSAEEYKRLSQSCKGEVQRVLDKALQRGKQRE